MTSVLLLGKTKGLRSTVFCAIKALLSTLLIGYSMGISMVYADTQEATADQKQSDELNRAIQQCARAKLHFAYRQENLAAHYAVTVDSNLHAAEVKITHPSGDKAFDLAVLDALSACTKYPEALRNSHFEGIFNYTR